MLAPSCFLAAALGAPPLGALAALPFLAVASGIASLFIAAHVPLAVVVLREQPASRNRINFTVLALAILYLLVLLFWVWSQAVEVSRS